MARRAIELEGIGKTLELSIVTSVKLSNRGLIHLDELSDGTWRLIYNKLNFPDLTLIESLDINKDSIQVVGTDIVLPTSKPALMRNSNQMILLEEGKSGVWQLKFSLDHMPNYAEIKRFKFIRED